MAAALLQSTKISGKRGYKDADNIVSISKKTVLRIIAAVLALLILASFISIIPAGHTDVNIIDFDFSDTYISAIEAKQMAQQTYEKAKTEQNQLTMEKQAEAERQVIAANAALEVSKIEAEAVEYAGQKKAAENKAIASSLSSQLIDYYTVQQWDGKLPTVTDGTPFISMQLPG